MDTTLTPEQELLEFFKALAEPKRLKLIGILAQKPCSVEELAAMVGLRESTVSHHLSYLSHAGLVSARAEGYYSIYQLEKGFLHRMAERLLAKETLPAMAEDVNLDAYDQKVMQSFLTAEGRLKALPAQEIDKNKREGHRPPFCFCAKRLAGPASRCRWHASSGRIRSARGVGWRYPHAGWLASG